MGAGSLRVDYVLEFITLAVSPWCKSQSFRWTSSCDKSCCGKPWINRGGGVGGSAEERFNELDAMLQFRRANKECVEMLGEMLEYAAWRLAKDDLENVTSWAWISNDPESFLVSSFMQNLELLRSSKRLIVTISPGILVA
jgi:hypothetical protein